MVDERRHERATRDDRGNPTPQWEVFCREAPDEPLTHVGSVAATSATEAHEHADRLFGWTAVDRWVCPADAVDRFSPRGLEVDGTDDDQDARDEESVRDDETAGTPRVTDA